MTYTNEEYANLAIKANEERKLLKIIDGELRLVEPEPFILSDEQAEDEN